MLFQGLFEKPFLGRMRNSLRLVRVMFLRLFKCSFRDVSAVSGVILVMVIRLFDCCFKNCLSAFSEIV